MNEWRAPVFVYSGFRASSTWLWSKFREDEKLLCYYEPFNEQLGNLTLANITQARPDSWRSHHPSGAPYLLEYTCLLGDSPGIPGFPNSMQPGDRFLSSAGPEGDLDSDTAAYVQGLISHSLDRKQTPVLACTRMLGRAYGFKSAFSGYHILLVRNLFHQWNSYAGQARTGNWYFLHTLYETLGLAGRDTITAQLTRVFTKEACSTFEKWVALRNFDAVFCYFVGFHLYYLTLTRRSADIVVDVNVLASSDIYRRKTVAQIEEFTGIKLDLDDACVWVDLPIHPLTDRQYCIAVVEEMATMIKSTCGFDPLDNKFIDGLVMDLWTEQARFDSHASSALRYAAGDLPSKHNF